MFDMSYEAKYHQLVSREITPRKNNKRWGYMALCPVKYTDQIDKILGGLIAELFRGQAVFACVSAFGIKVFNGSFDELF